MAKDFLEILSTNINGLNSSQKRKRTFTYLKKIKAEIICLQETHIRDKDEKLLLCKNLGTLFTVSDKEGGERGLATYIKEELNPKLIYAGHQGRILITEFQKNTKKILLVNIYAPNEKQEKFYSELQKCLADLNYDQICIIGDFNAVVNNELDRKHKSNDKRKGKVLPTNFFKMAEKLQ